MSEGIFRYFPSLSEEQKEKLCELENLYKEWNGKINVISRKDMENFMVHHVLHSLAIGKVINFIPGTAILDVGTGGGFPGIPLSIMFPDSQFTLLDSIGKKIKVVSSVRDQLNLKNVIPVNKRVEDENAKYDFVVSRAVTELSGFVKMTAKNIKRSGRNSLRNGILYLKGGDLSTELGKINTEVTIWNISDFFEEPFFETKKIVYLGV